MSYSCFFKKKQKYWVCEYQTKITETTKYWMFNNCKVFFYGQETEGTVEFI